MPFESSTVSCGNGSTWALSSARALASRRIWSSRSGRWPRISPWLRNAGSTQAWSIAFFFSSCTTHAGRRCAGSTTWAFVTSHPRPSTNHPVPVSMNGAGFTVTGPRPQFIVISASTRAVTRATAGLASRIASCTDSACAGPAASAAVETTTAPRSDFLTSRPYHGAATNCTPPGPASARERGRDTPVHARSDQQERGSVGFTPGQMSGVFGTIGPAPGVTTTADEGGGETTTVPDGGGVTTTVPVAGGATITAVRGLAWTYSTVSRNAVAGLR